MSKEYYCRQKFLYEADTDEIELMDFIEELPEEIQEFTESRNLFDGDNIYRVIPISYLDVNIDTKAEFEVLMQSLRFVTRLYILDDRPNLDNEIYQKLSEETIKCYLWWTEKYNINCKYSKIAH